MNLSKNQQKLIRNLQQKKYRQKELLFVAEGLKVVNELLASSIEIKQLFVLEEYNDFNDVSFDVTIITSAELKKISSLKTPNAILGIFKIPEEKTIQSSGLILGLDTINDPGNLGTIIRLCDWFGISQIVCSNDTVDCYNQKVIQSTMGSISRVQINYTNLETFLKNTEKSILIADMNGQNVYKSSLPSGAILVMGNEANGISESIRNLANTTLSIPQFGDLRSTESLNVAMATAILLSEFKRLT